jgi:amino acid transporter
MAAFLPHQRGFPGHASRFVGPSFGGTVGFTYYLKYLFATATQFSACAVIISYWIPATKVNSGVWIAIFIVFTASMQFAPVKYFGEFEFWCSTFKIITLTGLMIMALVIDLGGGPDHHRIGFAVSRFLDPRR